MHQLVIIANIVIKHSFCNASENASFEELAKMQSSRYWVERAFQDAKGYCGMAEYMVRSWNSWHHHMALVCLAMLFVLREKLRSSASVPLLSYRDLTELLDYYLPRRNYSEEEVMRQIQKRHRKRQQDLDRRQKSQI